MGDSTYCICSRRIDYGRAYIYLVCSRLAGCSNCSNFWGESGCTDHTVSGGCRGIARSDETVGKKYINSRTQRTNADRIIGETIRITERVSNMDQTGMAVVNGQEWTVRTRDDRETIEQGAYARVLEISGVKLIVEKA